MLLRLGWRDFKRNILLNTLVILLLMAVFAAVISGMSAMAYKFKEYKKIQPYLEQPGIFIQASALVHGQEKYLYKDSDEIRQNLNGAKDVLSVARLLAASYKGEEVNAWCYSDEVVNMLSPTMEEGRYFEEDDIYSDTLKAVVSHNIKGIKAGDKIRIDNDLIDGNYQEVEIIGVMQDGEDLYTPDCLGELTQDYRQCFRPYYCEVEDDKPVFLIAEQQILANQSKGWFTSVNYRLSNVGFMKEIGGPLIITYGEGVQRDRINNDMLFLIGEGSYLLMRKPLAEVDKNSRNYIFEDFTNLMPVIVCGMLFVLIATISASAVSIKKNLHNFAIYYLCGMRWMQCARISLVTSLISALGALALICVSIEVLSVAGKLEDTMITLGVIQLSACVVIIFLFVLAAWWLPIVIVNRMSAKEVLEENQ